MRHACMRVGAGLHEGGARTYLTGGLSRLNGGGGGGGSADEADNRLW